MKYPGAKTVLIPDITHVFRKSGLRRFVDVFGGSGIVALNVDSPDTVYNDIDSDLTNLFRTIQRHPRFIANRLNESIKSGELSRSMLKKRGNNQKQSATGKSAPESVGSDDRAFATLAGYMLSFGGMGDTYNTKEKSVHRYAIKTLQQFPSIQRAVASWAIDNLDFRDILKRHDSEGTFFYVDPPYFDRKWYNHNFKTSDYQDLAKSLESIRGKYLMNLDADHDELEDIFGSPDFVKRYENQNQNSNSGSRPPRLKAFYTNV